MIIFFFVFMQDRLNDLLNKNKSDIKLNICNVCGQYLPYNISEASMNLHNQNSVSFTYIYV